LRSAPGWITSSRRNHRASFDLGASTGSQLKLGPREYISYLL
jgi:hypothetical protein